MVLFNALLTRQQIGTAEYSLKDLKEAYRISDAVLFLGLSDREGTKRKNFINV